MCAGVLVSESTVREGYVTERRWCVRQVWAWWCVGYVRVCAVKVFEGLGVHLASRSHLLRIGVGTS